MCLEVRGRVECRVRRGRRQEGRGSVIPSTYLDVLKTKGTSNRYPPLCLDVLNTKMERRGNDKDIK